MFHKKLSAALVLIAVAVPALALAQARPPRPEPSVVVAVAGDIAGPWSEDTATGDLIRADASIDRVLTVGDNVYEDGTAAQYAQYYDPAWGSFKDKTLPVPGNHDWHTAEGAGYRDYFGKPTHYFTDLGSWRLIALDSERCESSTLLRDALASAGGRNVLAYWHHPLLNVGTEHGGEVKSCVRDWVAMLEQARAELVVTGHDHSYQRFGPVNGVRHFVAGTGGKLGDGLLDNDPDSAHLEKAIADQPGILRLELKPDSYSWSFVTPGGPTDSGSQAVDAGATQSPTPEPTSTADPAPDATPGLDATPGPQETPGIEETPVPEATPGPVETTPSVGDRCFIYSVYAIEHSDGTIDLIESPKQEVPCGTPGSEPFPEPPSEVVESPAPETCEAVTNEDTTSENVTTDEPLDCGEPSATATSTKRTSSTEAEE